MGQQQKEAEDPVLGVSVVPAEVQVGHRIKVSPEGDTAWRRTGGQ